MDVYEGMSDRVGALSEPMRVRGAERDREREKKWC
jgi:hypothetical protein